MFGYWRRDGLYRIVDAEGALAITFEGLAPAVPTLVRPFGENETRAYHAYE